jgi:hypothetical protein
MVPLENIEKVKEFYKKTKPWGFWGPIKKAVMDEDPSFQPNKDLGRDSFNIVIGIIWQLAQTVLPIYFLLRKNYYVLGWVMILIATSWLLKKYWWDKLHLTDEGYETISPE